MRAPYRHQLVRVRDSAWQRLLGASSDEQQTAALRLWAAHSFPLVVCRQPCESPADDALSVGLPGPLTLARGRWMLRIQPDEILSCDDFPLAVDIAPLLPESALRPWAELCGSLAELDVCARVYGSYGWQRLTGLAYLREQSDLDLYLPVRDTSQADEVARLLAAAGPLLPELDGELVLPSGAGTAWREWRDWRSGRVRELLVKRLRGVGLVRPEACEELRCL